jgi:hypothetical protein
MEARSWWQLALWGAAGGVLAFGATLLFRDPEPARTALELVDVACGASPAAQRRLLEEHVADELRIEIDDSGEDEGEPSALDRVQAGLSLRSARTDDDASEFTWTQAELRQKLAELNALSPHCRLSLSNYSLHTAHDGSEWVHGELDYSASQPGDLHAERRRVRAQFRRSGDQVQLQRLLLGAVERRVPEARP